jgi:succinate dehydrogenase / fumarate reductase cytochrome b subunit
MFDAERSATRKGGTPQTERAARGRWLKEYWDSTIGKKIVVAITGIFLAFYIVLHVLGNLKAFQGTGNGDPAIDQYAHWVRTLGSPALPHYGFLWAFRALLLAALIVHIVAIAQLTRRNRAARPAGYRATPVIQRSLASRTMMATGILVLAFLVFHILQFTTRTIQVTPVSSGTVYANLYDAFQKWYFVLIYVAAVALLGFHLRHAIWSVFQTAGWDKPNRNATIRRFATTLALAVTVGFAAVPLALWSDILPSPPSHQATVASRTP